MDLEGLSILAIRTVLAGMQEVPEEYLQSLAADQRAGVRAIREEILRRREARARFEAEQARMLSLEQSYHARGLLRVAGVDEAGRGPLAGPVVAGAVIFPPGCDYPPARDSKQLDPQRREELYGQIRQRALAVGVGRVEPGEIDRINIHVASLKAMYLAVEDLGLRPDAVIVDGPMVLRLGLPQQAVIGGDAKSLSIAAASIVAKVFRDRLMLEYDSLYPGYGFARHKGYCTAEHEKALRELGPCPIHRRTFHQVARCLETLGEDCLFFNEGLSNAASLEELEALGADIRQVRDSLSPLELNSLRRTYLRRRRELASA
jgi:ribonuclease HII